MLSVATRWRNWGRTETALPRGIVSARDTDEVVAAVRRARTENMALKVAGSGHSFSAIAVPAGLLLDISAIRGLIEVDIPRRQVTVGAGTPIHEITQILQPLGLAMPNLGDIDRQTLAGATSTGTHGTGLAFGGLSTQIVAMTLVTGLGEVMHIDIEQDATLLQASAVGLGSLGVITDITLACVPAFALSASEQAIGIDDAIDGFDDAVRAHDHHEFFWLPHTDIALTKTNTRLPATVSSQGPNAIRRFFDDEVLTNGALRGICAAGAHLPALTPPLAKMIAAAQSGREYTQPSTSVFVSARRVRFREMEYALPLAEIPEAVTELRALISRRGWRISFPIEVRAAASDNLMLSTATDRETGYIAIHRYHRDEPDDYFRAVEEIFIRRGGRPHWGKMHTCTARYLREAYPRFDEFCSIRDALDPDRIFSNTYVTGVLGR